MKFIKNNALYLAWMVSLVATLGSIYFSDIKKFVPCTLCWYQRIAMFPLVLLLPLGIYKKDKQITSYVLPLSLIGGLIALYQTLLYYSIIPEKIQPCAFGVSCTTKYVSLFGFAGIPLLSLIAFILISVFLIIYRRSQNYV